MLFWTMLGISKGPLWFWSLMRNVGEISSWLVWEFFR